MGGIKELRVAFTESRYAWRDFVDLFAIEGRLASLRLIQLIILALLGGLLIIIAWILLCLAGGQVLHQRYGWQWQYILLALAGVHLIATLVVVLRLRDSSKRLFFPATLAHLRGKNERVGTLPLSISEMERHREIVEASLERTKVAAKQAMRQSEEEFKLWITKPSVLLSAVAVGYFIAPRRKPAGVERTSHGLLGSVVPMILNQVMTAAIAKVVASIDRKHDTYERAM